MSRKKHHPPRHLCYSCDGSSIILRGLNDWNFGAQQLVLEVVVTSCADVEMNHTSLYSLLLILVEHRRAKHRQEKGVRPYEKVEERIPLNRSLGTDEQCWCVPRVER